MTNLPGYRLLSSTSNKQILFNRTKWTHCIVIFKTVYVFGEEEEKGLGIVSTVLEF